MKTFPSQQAVPQLLSRRTVLRHLGGLVLVGGGLAPLRLRLAALLPTGIVCLCLLVGLLVGCGASTSQPSGTTPTSTKHLKGTIIEFPIPTSPGSPKAITAGQDGNLWFTEGGAYKIGQITPSGTISELSVPTSASDPEGITKGPDGTLWFTEYIGNKIGRITTK
jgi:streptogramin lyase